MCCSKAGKTGVRGSRSESAEVLGAWCGLKVKFPEELLQSQRGAKGREPVFFLGPTSPGKFITSRSPQGPPPGSACPIGANMGLDMGYIFLLRQSGHSES